MNKTILRAFDRPSEAILADELLAKAKHAENVAMRLIRKRPPDEWIKLLNKIPKNERIVLAGLVFFDFSPSAKEMKTKPRFRPHFEDLLNAWSKQIARKVDDSTLISWLIQLGYTDRLANNRITRFKKDAYGGEA